MARFEKNEINAFFLGALAKRLKSGRYSWRVKGRRFGVHYNDGLWVVAQLQSSASPSQAGFRATIGVGSEQIEKVATERDAVVPSVHIGRMYEPEYYPEGLGTTGNAWMVMTQKEHAAIHAVNLGLHIESEACVWMQRCPTWDRFAEELRANGNPYYASLLQGLAGSEIRNRNVDIQ